MNIKRVFLFLFLPIYLFSYEISFSKEFTTKLEPDMLSTTVTISIEDKKEHIISNKIDRFNDFFKDQDNINIKNGRVSLNPRYRYINNKQEFLKYIGVISYQFESKYSKELNEFLSRVLDFKKALDDKNIKINISSINWIVTKEEKEKVIDKLKLDSILWIENYNNKLSQDLKRVCEIKKINISSRYSNPPIMYSHMAMDTQVKSSSAEIAPISSKKEIDLTANYIMECK